MTSRSKRRKDGLKRPQVREADLPPEYAKMMRTLVGCCIDANGMAAQARADGMTREDAIDGVMALLDSGAVIMKNDPTAAKDDDDLGTFWLEPRGDTLEESLALAGW